MKAPLPLFDRIVPIIDRHLTGLDRHRGPSIRTLTRYITSSDLGLGYHLNLLQYLPATEDLAVWEHRLRSVVFKVVDKQEELYLAGSPAVPPRPKRQLRRELKRAILDLEQLYTTLRMITTSTTPLEP